MNIATPAQSSAAEPAPIQNFTLANAFVSTIGSHDEVFDFRAISDVRSDIPAIPFRGTLADCWRSIIFYNNQQYGIFVVISELDGQGRDLMNVSRVRAHFVDLDNVSAMQNLQRAASWYPAPAFAVQSSAGKAHVYWPVQPYCNNDRFTLNQRKFAQFFDGDKSIVDATRLMRLPGTYHQKGEPQLVTWSPLPGYGQRYDVTVLEAALATVNVVESYSDRHNLGDPDQAAPSLDWLRYALAHIDPNKLVRSDWISFMAAFKQAGWNHADEATLFGMWSEWCAQYAADDPAENRKQWQSIRETQVGWGSILRRIPAVGGQYLLAGRTVAPQAIVPQGAPAPADPGTAHPSPPAPPGMDCSGEMLTDIEQRQWFAGCTFVTSECKIHTPHGEMMNEKTFNAVYGNKKFIYDEQASVTQNAWAAATNSTLWTIPKVFGTRFLPDRAHGEVITDDMGLTYVNVYRPANIKCEPGDVTRLLSFLEKLLPDPNDRQLLIQFIAHNVKYPGHKIPWAPVIQSTEGVGKNIIKHILQYTMGRRYFYSPKASDLLSSGAKFNAWLQNKLLILVDEIKVDDKRELVEVLKPLISEAEGEVQAKGQDQREADTPANWVFFTNHKDAVPVEKNGRRYAIFYSAIQSHDDLKSRGMDDAYFHEFYRWLGWRVHETGLKAIAYYLLNYPVERGAIPMRAPNTTSTDEAIRVSRGPIEQAILEAVEQERPGFRGGWVSRTMAKKLFKRDYSPQAITKCLQNLGYTKIGRATMPYFQEDNERPELFHVNRRETCSNYAAAQGYQ
ncbi:Primase C terminal 2 (PriCT-2) [Palleronia marisminoris]|uniref:Primase C-terminal 2 domain-containing protein n=1 Tax=Palleronia marisminoris TaxID=315423 RepID=A0A1Y5SAV5_9RHOB|nr:DUF5906 domain-containing protein [Palleronia marisminoris]SFG64918.1 Primase C terminal 2 (PriCT-2) [Palleronia marisminoris]SLN33555.1 hypothetical protein PAM7066_01370 [Palleronia marisminoris]